MLQNCPVWPGAAVGPGPDFSGFVPPARQRDVREEGAPSPHGKGSGFGALPHLGEELGCSAALATAAPGLWRGTSERGGGCPGAGAAPLGARAVPLGPLSPVPSPRTGSPVSPVPACSLLPLVRRCSHPCRPFSAAAVPACRSGPSAQPPPSRPAPRAPSPPDYLSQRPPRRGSPGGGAVARAARRVASRRTKRRPGGGGGALPVCLRASGAAAMAAAAAAGGAPGPGGGGGARRGARAAPTNILAQLRHGQLSGCGLTRGAQVRGGPVAGEAGGGRCGVRARCGGGGLPGAGLGRALSWSSGGGPAESRSAACPRPAGGLGQGLRMVRVPAGEARRCRGLRAGVCRPARPLGRAERQLGAARPLVEPRGRAEPRWPSGACCRGCWGAVSGGAGSSSGPGRSLGLPVPLYQPGPALVPLLEGRPRGLTPWGGRMPLGLRAPFPSFPSSVPL